MRKEDDKQFTENVIEAVEGNTEDGWSITFDKCTCFFVPADSPIMPKPGMVARFYGKGFGYGVRGLDIDGRQVFYRTEEEDEQHHAESAQKHQDDKKREFEETGRAELDAQYEALPELFQRRIDKFRNTNPDFRWQYEGYEMFACTEAVKIATALKTLDAVQAWGKLDSAEQYEQVPELSHDHSGNTFGTACRLAQWYLCDEPEYVIKEHGALTPLVGCEAYGCPHDEELTDK